MQVKQNMKDSHGYMFIVTHEPGVDLYLCVGKSQTRDGEEDLRNGDDYVLRNHQHHGQ